MTEELIDEELMTDEEAKANVLDYLESTDYSHAVNWKWVAEQIDEIDGVPWSGDHTAKFLKAVDLIDAGYKQIRELVVEVVQHSPASAAKEIAELIQKEMGRDFECWEDDLISSITGKETWEVIK